jgi:hypothetical protein
MLTIEKDIPLPENKKRKKIDELDIICKMLVGDSILIPSSLIPGPCPPRMMHGRIHTYAQNRLPHGRFSVRAEDDGYRLWRTR